jgi:hypothetical protein
VFELRKCIPAHRFLPDRNNSPRNSECLPSLGREEESRMPRGRQRDSLSSACPQMSTKESGTRKGFIRTEDLGVIEHARQLDDVQDRVVAVHNALTRSLRLDLTTASMERKKKDEACPIESGKKKGKEREKR